jgi:hypothetical protein
MLVGFLGLKIGELQEEHAVVSWNLDTISTWLKNRKNIGTYPNAPPFFYLLTPLNVL